MTLEQAWRDVHDHAARLKPVHLRDLFASDPGRVASLTFALDDLTIDFSKEKLDTPALDALTGLARAANVETLRDAMFAGEAINLTEDRAVLHTALRGGADAPEGDDVEGTLARFLDFAERVRSGAFAASGGPIADVINIGIFDIHCRGVGKGAAGAAVAAPIILQKKNILHSTLFNFQKEVT